MTSVVAGIDPHDASFTVGLIDSNQVELGAESFPNSAVGYVAAVEFLTAHSVELVGVEGSAGWGAHVSIFLAAHGFDVREVPPNRSARKRRTRRASKTDVNDSIATARALLAEPTLGPAQALEIYDPLVAKIEAVLEHRRALVETHTLLMHLVGDQLAKLPAEIRDQLPVGAAIESKLRALRSIDLSCCSTMAGEYRISWLLPLADQEREARAEIRRVERLLDQLLDQHGTTLREEVGIGTVGAATLVCEVGDPFRFSSESKFGRWCGVSAVAISSGEGHGAPTRHRLDRSGNRRINSTIHIASVVQGRAHSDAKAYLARKRSEGMTKRGARRAHKRQLANRIIRRMWRDEQRRRDTLAQAA
jgi:transposase